MDNNYLGISKEREIRLWNESIVVFDSSALLNFYEYSKATRKNIFDTTFKVLKDRLWIPFQVNHEFQKNRLKTLSSPIGLYNELKDQHLNKIQEQLNQLKNRTKKHNKHPYLEQQTITSFTDLFDGFKKTLIEEIDLRVSEINSMKESDDVLKSLAKYFKIGQEYSYSSLTEIIKEGEFRYRHSIPPGYKDQDEKTGFQIYGDLILWKQILDYAKFSSKAVILVIDDGKEDWWHLTNKREMERPREELILEMKEVAKVDFWMYSSVDFLEKANEILDTKIKENAIMEVRNASSHHNAYLAESAFTRWAIKEYYNVGEVTVPSFMQDGPTDLIVTKPDGTQIGFVVKFFREGRNRFVMSRLRGTLEHIDHRGLRLKFERIVIVLITENDGAAEIQLSEFEHRNQLSMFAQDDKIDFIFGYLRDDEFVRVR